MRIYEFAGDDPYRVKLSGIVNQIKSDWERSNTESPLKTSALINILGKNGIVLTKDQLFDMIKQDPLKNIIKNISGEKVTFFGQEEEPTKNIDSDQSEKIVKDLAKKSLK